MRFLSQVYTIARGSVGGITYTANQWHQLVARARTSPVQPNTPFQTGIRSAFDAAEDDWRALTQAQRDDWTFYALTCVFTGPLGTYTVPGRQLFIGTLAWIKYAKGRNPGLSIVETDTPPVIAGFFNPGSVLVSTYGGGSQGIALDVGNPGAEPAIAAIDISIAFNPSRNRYKGPWISSAKSIQVAVAGANTHFDLNRPAGTLNQIVFTRTRLVTAVTSPADPIPHRESAVFYLRHLVEAGP